MKTFSILLIIMLAGFFLVKPSLAAVRCETQYGGKEVCIRTGKLQVNKEVFDPRNKKFVDNLGLNDHKFSPGEQVTFKIKVKNVGDNTFDAINVLDILPDLLKTDGNPQFQIKDLKVGEEKEQEIKVKVAGADKFPRDKSVVCVVNVAEAVSGEDKDRDTAQVCLERKVLPQKGAPVL
ncbi:hypothetical protein HYS29_00675, partial [Candidatus Microgenomates bacterium]|nr:hypothetical protein [Candidatus Microgenomates bacterium]